MGILSYEVKYQREWLGMSLLEFSRELGKSMALVGQFENGERQVTEQHLIDIRERFGYIPLSQRFKESLKIEFREPPVTAKKRGEFMDMLELL